MLMAGHIMMDKTWPRPSDQSPIMYFPCTSPLNQPFLEALENDIGKSRASHWLLGYHCLQSSQWTVISTSLPICICVFKNHAFILIHSIPVQQHRIPKSFPSFLIYNSFLQQEPTWPPVSMIY